MTRARSGDRGDGAPQRAARLASGNLERLVAYGLLALVALFICAVRVRLLEIPLERDEGDYAYSAQLILDGVPLYGDLVRIRFPAIGLLYAAILSLFGQTIAAVHLGLLIVHLSTLGLLFVLADKLHGKAAGLITAAAFGILLLNPNVQGFSANREQFVILFAVAGLLTLLIALEKNRSLLFYASGLLFGAAFLVKQHGALFGLFGGLFLTYAHLRRRPVPWAGVLRNGLLFSAGAITLYGLVCLYFWQGDAFDRFWHRTVTYPRAYASSLSVQQGISQLHKRFWQIFPPEALLWSLAALGIPAAIFNRRLRSQASLSVGFTLASVLATVPGWYFRPHYFVLIAPAAALSASLAILSLRDLLRRAAGTKAAAVLSTALAVLALAQPVYGQREFLFRVTPVMACRMTYGFNPFPEAVHVGRYIKENTKRDDKILVLGSEPEILFYAQRRSAIEAIYMYDLTRTNEFAPTIQRQTIAEAEANRPAYVVVVDVPVSWLLRSNSHREIFDWIPRFLRGYAVDGVVDIAVRESKYVYGPEAATYAPQSPLRLTLFKRRD